MNSQNEITRHFLQCSLKWQTLGLLVEKSGNGYASHLLEKARKSSTRKGFGSRYYYMMRLLDAFLATKNLCLTDDAPHKAAGSLLEEWFHFLTVSPKRIVSARHRLKYEGVAPRKEIVCTLEKLITILETLIQLNHPANSLQATGIGLQHKILNS